eukprot:gene12108-13759_t
MSAIPEELTFPMPPTLVASRTYEYRTNPSNANSFSTEGAVIQLTLPNLPRSFYQNNTIYVRGRCALTITPTAEANASLSPPISFTSAGAYSLFSRQVVRTANGQTLETVQNPGIVSNIQMSYGLTPAERVGMSSITKIAPTVNTNMGVCTSLGWQLGIQAPRGHNAEFEFCIPLNSVLTNGEKFIPCFYDEIVIELTIAQLLSATAGAQNPTFIIHRDTASITAFTMSDLELCAQVIELGPTEFGQLMSQYPQGITLKSQSYVYGSSTLAANTTGTQDIVYSHKQQSIKQFIMAVSPTNAAEGPLYSGVNPNLGSLSLILNGQTYPQRPIRAFLPSETYAQNQKAYGALMSDLKCGSVPMEYHAVASTAYNTFHDAYKAFAVATSANAATAGVDVAGFVARSNKCFFLLDLESINGSKSAMFNGISTTGSGSSSTIRLDINASLANTSHNVHYFSVYDCLIKFDPVMGITVRKIGDKENRAVSFFKDNKNEILDHVEGLEKPQTKKTLLSALFVLTSDDDYREKMLSTMKIVNDHYKEQKTNPDRLKNLMSFEEVKRLHDEFKAAWKSHPTDSNFFNLLISSLCSGVVMPPRRVIDYAVMKIAKYD